MIVGTAGHIDHGKTALVHALTGVDTDRLPEEKKRGITIELGYASALAPDGTQLSFVDVPGHEKFVRTMVSGATGMDYALLLIAADDGIMPQTTEHASILSLLGIKRGMAVITKVDRVSEAEVAQRIKEAQQLLQAQGLSNFSVTAVSALRGDGVADLKARLFEEATQGNKSAHAWQGFRMDLDRVFSLSGMGTVVAGSIAAGQVQVGDSLCLAHEPTRSYRVRSLHSHHSSVQQANTGQRCAITLVGLERSDVERGMSLCSANIALSTQRIDAYLNVLTDVEKPLRSGSTVHLHVGTQEVMATVAVLGESAVAAGQSGLVQLIAQRQVHAWHGDRIILRDASATRTLAGGQVLDPLAPQRYRQTPERLAWLHILREEQPSQRLHQALQHAPLGISVQEWWLKAGAVGWPFDIHDVQLLPATVFAENRQWLIAEHHLNASEQAVLKALTAYHQQHSNDLGPDTRRMRKLAAPRMPEALWLMLLSHMSAAGKLGVRNGYVNLPEHGQQLREADRIVAERALPLLQQGHFDPPWVRDIAGTARLSEVQVRSVLSRLAKTGDVFQVVKDLFFHPFAVQDLARLVREIHEREGEVTAASYRDATGLGRKRAIQILEFFDRIGFLLRVGDVHFLRPGTTMFEKAKVR